MKRWVIAACALGPSAGLAEGDAENGRELIEKWRCVECHGLSGNNRQAGLRALPMIAGQSVEFLTMRLAQYRDGFFAEVDESMMSTVAGPLSDQEIADIAAWYTGQKRY